MSPTWPSMPHFGHRSPPLSSSVYSGNNHHARSAALRPLSALLQRFTPRLGQQKDADVEAGHNYGGEWQQQQHHHHHEQQGLYEASAPPHSATVPFPQGNPFADPVEGPKPLDVYGNVPRRPEAVRMADHPANLPIALGPEAAPQPPRPLRTTTRGSTRPHGHKKRHRRRHATKQSLKPARSAWKDPDVRVKLMHACISGLLFSLTLIVFLAIQGITPVFSPPFRIVNSLLIIFFAIVFVHSCIRLGTVLRAAKRRLRRVARKNAKADGLPVGAGFDSTDFAVHRPTGSGSYGRAGRAPYFDDPEIGLPPPGEPFRVVLARDEELGIAADAHQADAAVVVEDDHHVVGNAAAAAAAGDMHDDLPARTYGHPADAGVGSDLKPRPPPPPPVYGVWRGSMRADPNLLHWQRVHGPVSLDASDTEEMRARPPPSYRTEEDRRRGEAGGMGGLQTLPNTRYVI